eukprot:g13012.t1
MLQLYKNQVVTDVTKQQIDLRGMELDWYCSNYDTMAVSSTMLAGFAYDQLTTPIPASTSWAAELSYVLLTAVSLGLSLSVAVTCIFSVVFGKSLALRGSLGAPSVNIAVDNLRNEQKILYLQFVACLLSYLVSHLLEITIMQSARTASFVLPPMIFFFLLIVYFTLSLTVKLQVRDNAAIVGTIAALAPYDNIRDLDASVYEPLENRLRAARQRESDSRGDHDRSEYQRSMNTNLQHQHASANGAARSRPAEAAEDGGILGTFTRMMSSDAGILSPFSREPSRTLEDEPNANRRASPMLAGTTDSGTLVRPAGANARSSRLNASSPIKNPGAEQVQPPDHTATLEHHHDEHGPLDRSSFMGDRRGLFHMFDPITARSEDR